MKKIILIFNLVALMCIAVFAEETNSDFNFDKTSGGFWISQEGIAGGAGEFGLKITENENGFFLRDCIYIEGFGANLHQTTEIKFGGMIFGDKLLFGGQYLFRDFAVRSYGFLGGGVGIFKCENHGFFETPLLTEMQMGGGFEFQFSENMAFVIEFGGNFIFPIGEDSSSYSDYQTSSPILTIGYRTTL